MRPTTTRGRRRRGFTLIEMMIVIAIMLILISLAAGLSPKFLSRKNVTYASDQISGVLNMAKQRARRDRLPTGVRLVPPKGKFDPKDTDPAQYFVTELMLVQQPDPLAGSPPKPVGTGSLLISAASGQMKPADASDPAAGMVRMLGPNAIFQNVNFHGGNSPAHWQVQPGDYLEVNGGGIVHKIVGVGNSSLSLQPPQGEGTPNSPYGPNAGQPRNSCTLLGDGPTHNWRIIRRPRPLFGESPLRLKGDMMIDCTPSGLASFNLPIDPSTGNIDIIFSPGGGLLVGGAGSESIFLWLRDAGAGNVYGGEPVIIAVNSRSGFIAAHPVAQPPEVDPYKFARDGQSSGM